MKIEKYKKEFEVMTYEELSEIYKVLSKIKSEKYSKSETRRKAKKRANDKWKANNLELYKEIQRKSQAKYIKKSNIREQRIEYLRKRRIKKRREEIEKTIALSDKMATKQSNIGCVFDVSQLWNVYEHDNS